MPKLTVLLPAYQCGDYLEEAFQGLVAQTERDFEVWAFYDQSTDDTLEKLLAFPSRDARWKIFIKDALHPVKDFSGSPQSVQTVALPRGEFSGLNFGLKYCQTEFIAIHHGDDISLPARFERQFAFLQSHPEIGLVGTWAEEFNGTEVFPQYPAHEHEQIKAELLIHGPIIQGSSLFWRSSVGHPPCYFPEEFGICADKAWQIQMVRRTQVANVREVLYRKRYHRGQVSQSNEDVRPNLLRQLAHLNLETLGLNPTTAESDFHRHWPCVEKPWTSYRWAQRLLRANRAKSEYREDCLKKMFSDLWMSALRFHMPNRWLRALYFWFSPISSWGKPKFTQRLYWVWRLWKKDYVLSIWFQK